MNRPLNPRPFRRARALSALLGALLLYGCAPTPPPVTYAPADFELREVRPPAQDLTGQWSAAWKDPLRRTSEKFAMDLTQRGNVVTGRAEFMDAGRTQGAVTGQVSGAELSLLFTPDRRYFGVRKASWVGVVTNGTITGTWYLHGKPISGYANTGPWSATLTPSARKPLPTRPPRRRRRVVNSS